MGPAFPRRLFVQIPLILALVALLALVQQKPEHKVQPASPSQPHVSLANFRRIELGMSVTQAQAILGIPGDGIVCGEGQCTWLWREGPDNVVACFGQRDGKATCASFFSYSEGKQYWLHGER